MNKTLQHPVPLNIYLINLPERTDRLADAKKELERVGWSLGNTVTLYNARRFAEKANFPSASIRGAFHSHHECLRAAASQESGHVILLEDDIAFAECFPSLLNSVLVELAHSDWDLCYLGHEDTGAIPKALGGASDVKLLPYAGPIIGLHFCMINRRLLPRLIEHLDRLASGKPGDDDYGPMPVDGAFNTFRRLNPFVRTLIAIPKLGWQRSSRSDISPKFLDRFELLRPTLKFLRRLKHSASGFRR